MLTEQPNPNTQDIDQLSTQDILQRINQEDMNVPLIVQQALPQLALAIDAIVPQMEKGGRLIYVGSGTSGRLGVLDAVECVPTFGVPNGVVIGMIAGGVRALTQAIEGAEDDAHAGRDDMLSISLSAKDIVVGIAASGATPYVLGAVQTGQEYGAITVGIACNVPSPLLDAVQYPIGIPVGPEVIAGSTRMKAGTAQKLILNMLSTTMMVKLGKVYGNLMVDVQVTNAKLARRAQWLVKQIAAVDDSTAADLLLQANKNVKIAVIMHKRGVTAEEAQTLLAAAGGWLRHVIG